MNWFSILVSLFTKPKKLLGAPQSPQYKQYAISMAGMPPIQFMGQLVHTSGWYHIFVTDKDKYVAAYTYREMYDAWMENQNTRIKSWFRGNTQAELVEEAHKNLGSPFEADRWLAEFVVERMGEPTII